MDGYRVKHNLSYQQFSDIIKKLLFHNLNFDKNIVKFRKKCKENYARLLKNEKRTKRQLLVTFGKYLLND